MLLLAACGSGPEAPPPDPALVVKAENGATLRGEAWIRTSKLNPTLLTVDLAAGQKLAATTDDGFDHEWGLRALVSREQVLANQVPPIPWPSSTADYESAHVKGDSGTATLKFEGGRLSGSVKTEAGEATFESGIHIECLVDRDDFTPPADVPFGTKVNDVKFVTKYCSPLKALQ
jgi:hypothetical protein